LTALALLSLNLPANAQSTLESSPVSASLNLSPTDQPTAQSIEEPQFTFFVFLPVVLSVERNARASPPPAADLCRLNANESVVADLMAADPDQGRPQLRCHPILAQVARARAVDMGRRDYFSHTTPEGYGPNYLVRQAGFALPEWYNTATGANNIESIAAGYISSQEVWNAWTKSSQHRTHILAQEEFWAEQVEYGIGYAFVEGSRYGHYWVVLTAPAPAQ
jgi:uncharacterized protein YkwD